MISDKDKAKKPEPKKPEAAKPEAKKPAEEKRRGRPKGSKTGSRGPAGKEAVRVTRKKVDEIKDTRAAIARYHDDQQKLIARYRKEHPGAMVGDAVDPFKVAPRERIEPEFFSQTLKGISLPVYASMDVRSAFPDDAAFNACGKLWSETSVHFEMSKWIILSAAIVTTVGLILPAVATRFTKGPDSAQGQITARPVDPADGKPNV